MRDSRIEYDHSTAHPMARLHAMHDGICWLCRRPCELADASRDHVIPRSLGGAYVWGNLALAHRLCNMERKSRFPAGTTFRGITARTQRQVWSASKGCCRGCGSGRELFFSRTGEAEGVRVEVWCVYCTDPSEFAIRDTHIQLRIAAADRPSLRIEPVSAAARPTVTPADIVRRLNTPAAPQAVHAPAGASRPRWRRALDTVVRVLRRAGED